MKKKTLTTLQHRVTQEKGTEPPFDNEYCHHYADGIYVDMISGKALFCSIHKYDSGSGWPSFFQPIDNNNIVEHHDVSHGMQRIEVRSKKADSHLGHVFHDGPKPTGLRYCINSAALRFIPKHELAQQGYEPLLVLFEK